jgi:hypothetical protein
MVVLQVSGVAMRHNLTFDYITDTTKTLADTSHKDSTSSGSWGSSEKKKSW